MSGPEFTVDIEVYDTAKNDWAQARYLVHSLHDVLWTDSIEDALQFLRDALSTPASIAS